MKKTILTLLLLFAGVAANGQTTPWLDYAVTGFVFEISNDEAEALLKSDPRDSLVRDMMHTEVARWVGQWDRELPPGHYIFARIIRNTVECNYSPVAPFDVYLYSEWGMLSLQVTDRQGNVVDDARVRLERDGRPWGRAVRFDPRSLTYRLGECSEDEQMVLTVEHDGFRSVIRLNKHRLRHFTGGGGKPRKPEFFSYMLTDKNKYKPGETVRFKSYALGGNRRPMEEELEVWVDGEGGKYRKVTTVAPYNAGGYAGGFTLHDSLELRLDRSYSIQLRDGKGRVAAHRRFLYEDYVLYDNKLTVDLKRTTQYHPDTNSVEIEATDANGLPLPDLTADVAVLRHSVNRSYVEVLTLRDTLWHDRVALNNGGPTTVDIPAALFGEADCDYKVLATVITNDGQRLHDMDWGHFFRHSKSIDASTHGDTIRFEYTEAGKPQKVEAELLLDGAKQGRRVTLPFEERFDQRRKEYRFKVVGTDYEETVLVRDIDPELEIAGGIDKGAFDVRLINPLGLELSWNVYQANRLVDRGVGREFHVTIPKTDMDREHYVEAFYVMGGRQMAFYRTFTPRRELTVETDLPERIYPGQRVDATVRVTDHMGNPVEGTDLTAMGWNSLLDYRVPDMPYHGGRPRLRDPWAGYGIEHWRGDYTLPLDYAVWRERAGLDTLPCYRLRYPDGLFRHETPAPDHVAQFAPYVMKQGRAVDIYVIEDNGRPVWFSWAEQPRAYSFPVDPSRKHTITLRLHDRALVIDSLVFRSLQKTTLSIDLDHPPRGVRTVMLSNKDRHGHYIFNSVEGRRYGELIARMPVIDHRRPNAFDWRDGSELVYHPLLSNQRLIAGGVLAGPVPQVEGTYGPSARYFHEGGFRYMYAPNVVYKYPEQVLPDSLVFSSRDEITTLDDFHLSPAVLAEKVRLAGRRIGFWQPEEIHISQHGLNLRFRLPERKDSVGVANLLFRDRATDKIVYPDRVAERGRRVYTLIPPATVYDVILLYADGGYLRRDSVAFERNVYTEVDMARLKPNAPDSLSQQWLKSYASHLAVGPDEAPDVRLLSFYRQATTGYGNTVAGYVYEPDGTPLVGAAVSIAGAEHGTVTDLDGWFELDIEGHDRTIVISYIGYETRRMNVTPRTVLQIVMEQAANNIEDIVIMGSYTRGSESFTGAAVTYSANSATEMAGDFWPEFSETMAFNSNPSSAAENALGALTNFAPSFKLNGPASENAAEERLYRELLTIGGLRTNFSDVGFWEPALVTDRRGEARFTVTFPDNITRWDAAVFAMNRRLQTGAWRGEMRSYKPLMAELRAPQFMVAGDTARLAAGVRNYTSDSLVRGRVEFVLDGDTLARRQVDIGASHSERFEVTAPAADSLTATYLFTRDDGYNDGERRTLAIEPLGTEVAEGTLGFLRDGERADLAAAENQTVDVIVTGNQLDVYTDAADYLSGYKYDCNEQLASKLIGLLGARLHADYRGERFRHDKQVNELIRRLTENRNGERLWSWWGRSGGTSHWMSAHIMRALKMARDQGYTVDLDLRGMTDNYFDVSGYRNRSLGDIEILHALSDWGVGQPYARAVEYWEGEIARLERDEATYARRHGIAPRQSWLNEKMLLWEIRQRQGVGFVADSVARYLKKDVLGAVYCDDGIERSWWGKELRTTLTAYRIAGRDSTLRRHREAMAMYILGTKQRGWNTYRAADAVATVLPDLLASGSSSEAPAVVAIGGRDNLTVSEFPYRTTLAAGERLSIEKRRGIPLVWSAWTTERRTEARTGEAFDIATRMSGDGRFHVGQVDTLVVTVRVKQRGADHVMIEVPIPAGCDYASKRQSWPWQRGETHREYFKERTVIFCEHLSEGEYTFRVDLLPRFAGSYTLNPAKVELMYFPVVGSNNGISRTRIE
jgi:hypothetical protein